MGRSSACECPLLHREIGVEVDLCRFDALVSKPEGDDRAIHSGLEQVVGGRVAKDMRCDVLPSKRHASTRGGVDGRRLMRYPTTAALSNRRGAGAGASDNVSGRGSMDIGSVMDGELADGVGVCIEAGGIRAMPGART